LSALDSKITGTADFESLKNELTTLDNKVEELAKAQEASKFQVATPLDVQIETAIPIRKERALAPLTDTELRVLEFIASGGERTAPEVKDKIKLTREHTARLMKKLYEAGYLERRPEKIPYAYRVKDEMLKILKKTDINA
jgi:DNA-binding CsgD family transcriptional regulator